MTVNRLSVVATLMFFLSCPALADDWAFVWLTSGIAGYSVEKGKAQVSITGSKLSAKMIAESGVEYELHGTITKAKVTAALTVLGSDYFVNSPFSGTISKKRWSGFAESKGRETISLLDGFNFVGLTHDLH